MITNNLLSEEVIIRGEWVLSMSDEGAIRDGAVHISDGIVKHVNKYSKLKEKLPGIKTIGNGSGIVTPGLINAHTHLSEALIPGMGSEMTLFEWGREIVTPVGEKLDIETAR